MRDIKGTNGDYKVSDAGEVISFKHDKVNGRLLKPINNGIGYLQVGLYMQGKTKKCSIHRLVAGAYLPNPENKLEVNHIDGDTLNNHVDNLEWCTSSENMQHAYANGLTPEKPVNQLDLDGNFIKEFKSTMEAERQLKIYQTNICKVCLGTRKTAGKFKWEYTV